MELRQLEYFVAVVEEAGFTRAAERVHISQSGVSAQVRALERELGAQLIDRLGRTATLTPAGAAVLEHARTALAAAGAVRQAVDDVNGLVRGRLAVGMVTGCTLTRLFDALAAFRRAHPGVEVALAEDNSDRLTADVRSGALDIALIGTADAAPDGLESMTILSERLVAVMPAEHRLARRRARLTLADLADVPLVCLPAGTGIRTVFDRACARRGVAPAVALEASAPQAVADLAARGLGVAILSESMAGGDGLRARVIADVEAPAALALVWRAEGSPALRALVGHARAAFG